MNIGASSFRTAFDNAPADLGSGPIPAAPYYKPEYFELEKEAIFRRTWLHIGHVCEIPAPGSFMVRPVEALNVSVLFVHGKDGVIRGFHNVCPHRGTILVTEGEGRRSLFSCRYHRWTFGDDGALKSAPDFAGFDLDKSECGLKPVSVDTCGGFIFVNLDPDPDQGLREFLGDYGEGIENSMFARATRFSEFTYEIDANWKLAYDNFQEIYHLRFIHPRSAAMGYGAEENPFGYPAAFGFNGVHRTQTFWNHPSPTLSPTQRLGFSLPLQSPRAPDDQAALTPDIYYALFPSIFIRVTATMPFTQQIVPLTPTRSRGIFRFYWNGPDENASMRFAREFGMANLRDVASEDRDVVIDGQIGLSSGALEHIHFHAQEAQCRHLYNVVDAMVRGYQAEQAGRRELAR